MISKDELLRQFPDWPFEEKLVDSVNRVQCTICFEQGKIDWWKVKTQPILYTYDTEWLEDAKSHAEVLGKERLYTTFVGLYNLITPDPYNLTVCSVIGSWRGHMKMAKWLLWLRYAMLAEERLRVEDPSKPNGKRLKRLALLQVLYHGFTPKEAANWSKSPRPASETAAMCRKYGF